jgi:hypothetical protein
VKPGCEEREGSEVMTRGIHVEGKCVRVGGGRRRDM